MAIETELKKELENRGADFVYFVDISQLTDKKNKQFPNAILFGVALSPVYIQKVSNTPDYVPKMISNNQIEEDEFHVKEKFTDKLADDLAEFITSKGYSAYSQSEDNIYSTGYYDEKSKITPLPHKTIAGLAGFGWIGKHNLLINPEFGSAISMCTVLTDAPLNTVLHTPVASQCGDCKICKEVCLVRAIKGNNWSIGTSRDEMLNVHKCKPCLQCMVHCPFTQRYIKKNLLI